MKRKIIDVANRIGLSLVILIIALLMLLAWIVWPHQAAASQIITKRPPQEQEVCPGCPTPSEIKKFNDFQQKMGLPPLAAAPPAVAQPLPLVAPAPTIAVPIQQPPAPVQTEAVPAVTQSTVTTTVPVTSSTTISVGDLAGQVLTWAITAFGSLIATIFAAWGIRLFKLAGVQITDAARDRLQQIILNGLNNAAQNVTHDIAGKGQVDVKDAVVQQAIVYAQNHGADAIKQLGLDPNSGAAVEAIKARIATAVADPSVPTPPILNGSNPIPAKAA